jgi:hypothetical protein
LLVHGFRDNRINLAPQPDFFGYGFGPGFGSGSLWTA